MNTTAPRRRERRKRAALPPLPDRMTILVHRINARLAQAANPVFRRHKLDLYSSRILVALLESRRSSVGDLVELMVLPQSTISHQLRRLETLGLIHRRRDSRDNRSVSVTLTAKGKSIARECNEVSRMIHTAMIESFGARELDRLRADLRRMFANLARF